MYVKYSIYVISNVKYSFHVSYFKSSEAYIYTYN